MANVGRFGDFLTINLTNIEKNKEYSFQQESFWLMHAFHIFLCIYWDELIGIPYLKCNPGGDCCWVQEHPNVPDKHRNMQQLIL